MAGVRSVNRALRSLSRWIAPQRQQRRLSAAAALAEAAHWTDWEEEDASELERRRRAAAGVPETAPWGEREAMGVRWAFMGSPVAQKRACATRLAEILEVPYISTGTLVRQELHPRSALYKKIANAVNEGRLVPEDIIFGLLSQRLEEGWQRGETGFILDGIPRTRMQAEILDQITEIDLVVDFKSVDDCLVTEHLSASICSYCGKPFDASNSEATSINPCLHTSSRHTQLESSTAADRKNARLNKFHFFCQQRKLLEEYYKEQKKFLEFKLSGGPGETWRGLLAALHLQHIDTIPVKKPEGFVTSSGPHTVDKSILF